MNIQGNTVFSFPKYIAWQIEPTEKFVYVLNKKNNRWFYLNNVSKDIWLLIEKKKNVNDITNELVKEYEQPYDAIYSDVVNFIDGLLQEMLLIY